MRAQPLPVTDTRPLAQACVQPQRRDRQTGPPKAGPGRPCQPRSQQLELCWAKLLGQHLARGTGRLFIQRHPDPHKVPPGDPG